MSITLRPETERQIEDRMKAGRYPSPDDVVKAGLRLLEEREREHQEALSEVRDQIAVGLGQLKRGEGIDADPVFEEMLGDLERDDKGR